MTIREREASRPGAAEVHARACIDGNEAAARVAYALSEVIAIYPITPASPMGELADAWSSRGRPNLWGAVPEVVELQSEAGAAGAIHGALQGGALATTFTASQGLLLMLPNMFKIAGELTPTVIHVAARTLATHALSIFGDHSDVMATRPAGFAMLASGSVQEAQDLALVAHLATLASRVPFLHFFDGFRTSHEINRIEALSEEDIRALLDDRLVHEHRARGLNPERPVLRGSAQNPDVFFQAREAANPFYASVPDAFSGAAGALAERTGRRYGLVDYTGHTDAERVLVLIGSGAGAATEAVERLCAAGEPVGLIRVRLYRPFPAQALVRALPEAVRAIAVLDRTKEPGAVGEPLYQDVVAALAEHGPERFDTPPRSIGGRYGLSSKEFTPAMAKRILDELATDTPRNHFTVGIVDDVSGTSLDHDPGFATDGAEVRAILHGLGSDGTVGSCKSSAKIIGERTDLHAQGYFVYDAKKAGSRTTSHLRFSRRPIRSTYLISEADLVACHQFGFLDRVAMLEAARHGATFLLNSPHGPDEVWERLPGHVRRQIVEKDLELHVIDAYRVAGEAGMGMLINTVMQPCFFALAGIMPREEAIEQIKRLIEETYGERGRTVVERNFAAVDAALDNLHRVEVPARSDGEAEPPPPVPDDAPDFVRRVTAAMLADRGDALPVSALPVDGTFPTGTARWEKRAIAEEIPVWDPEICIDCGRCAIYCPHAAIRMKVFEPEAERSAPEVFLSKPFRSKELPGMRMTIQVAPDDCTGCGVCVDMCPAHSKEARAHQAINMEPASEHRQRERTNWEFFLSIPQLDRTRFDPGSVKSSQLLEPLFEFSGACAGCGETPYLMLLSQLFGDRMVIANATGCSSIFGGNLPTTPWTVNREGRGPAWANSLFEDNAEFGLGIALAQERRAAHARALIERLAPKLGEELAGAILGAEQADEAGIAAQRDRVAELTARLAALDGSAAAQDLASVASDLVRRSVWIVGGDGWAYDIGSAGLDHVLATGRNVNVLVLDTEVYSNTGGQASKATPRAAVAKFAAAGKRSPKKDLGIIASAYGDVYVAQVAIGADPTQTVKAFLEADAWHGPSLLIAYSACIAHGIDMTRSMSHQRDAVRSGHWPLYRYRPGTGEHEHPLELDSKAPQISIRDFAGEEARFAMLERSDPEAYERLIELAQADADERWRLYEQLAGIERTAPHPAEATPASETPAASGHDPGAGRPDAGRTLGGQG